MHKESKLLLYVLSLLITKKEKGKYLISNMKFGENDFMWDLGSVTKGKGAGWDWDIFAHLTI